MTGLTFDAGCLNCKARHTRCDEKLPVCSNCERFAVECQPTDFILHSTWSATGNSQTQMPSSRSGRAGAPTFSNVDDALLSLVRPPTSLDMSSSSQSPLAGLLSPHMPLTTPSSPSTSPCFLPLSNEVVRLLETYNSCLAPWMDLCDHGCTFQRDVSRIAMASELVLKCVCAFSAKHLSLLASGGVWQPVASHYYGEALALLIRELGCSQPQIDALTAAMLLSSYEVLVAHGDEHKRHFQGALNLIRLRGINAQSLGLDRANFWIYIRHELSMALSNGTPLHLHPQDWKVTWPEAGAGEDCMANCLLWLAARAINATYGDCQQGDRVRLKNDIERWYDATSPIFRGNAYGQADRDGLRRVYFAVPAAGQSYLMTHHFLYIY